MTMAQTPLQQERKTDQAQINLGAAQQHNVTPNQGSVVPNIMQTRDLLEKMLAEKNSMPNITPPSEDEIQEQMWISSGIIGLLGAIVSGNPAGGIACGMTAALAIHDRGYDLRQRAQHVMELHNQGYSARAIENWYETGDNKELDKETDNMQRLASEEFSSEAADRRQAATMEQQREFHADQMEQERLSRAQSQANANRSYNLAVDNADRADRRADKQEQSQFDSEMRKAIDGPKQKLQNAIVAEQAYGQLADYMKRGRKDLIPGAFNNLNHALARVQVGGNATLTDDQVKNATGLLSYTDRAASELGVIANGMPTKEWMASVGQQIQDDKKNESTAITQVAGQAYQNLVDSGIDPNKAHKMVVHGLVGTSTGAGDLDVSGGGGNSGNSTKTVSWSDMK